MTRRERLEAKAEKRLEWAVKADGQAEAQFERANRISERFAGGEPIHVGHHSEAGARADQRRIHNAMNRGLEEQSKATYHANKAAGLGRMLRTSILSDDDDAIALIEKRIAEREARAAQLVAENVARRKAGETAHPAWELSNLRGNIRSDKQRVEQIRGQQTRAETAAESTTGVTIEGGEWIRVTFAEKPGRDILDALRVAGYRWGGGSWVGERAKLPNGIAT